MLIHRVWLPAFEEIFTDKMGTKDWRTGAGAGAVTGGFYAGLFGASTALA